jgi:HEAT repeat protein/energy-coupling factor transporter ATP-binding protein EcfA2
MRKPTKGPVVQERVWCFIKALLTYTDDLSELKIHWEDENTHRPKLVVNTKRRYLENLANLKQSEFYEVINSLKNLEILEDRRPKQKGGSDNWCFALKLWSMDEQKNKEQFDKLWEDSKTDKQKALAEKSQKTDKFDWHHICQNQLEKQKRLTTNQLLNREDTKHEVEDIHVPLALVERTKPDKRNPQISAEEGSRLYEPSYEEKQRFKHEDFLGKVLETGTGKTQGKRIAVIGEPGAGKTTLLQTIAGWILEKNLGFPIWVSLADLQGKTLEEYLQRWLKNALEVKRVTEEEENRFLELFQSGKVWLLLDGVDEMGMQNRSPLHWVSSQLEGWVKNARVVLSCRLNVWEANLNALEDFETYRLLNFSYPEQVQQFIRRWFDRDKLTSPPTPPLQGEGSKSNSPPSLLGKGAGGLGQTVAEQLWNELDKPERQRLQDLVKNPLRLALLCATWQGGDKKLPDTKAGLYSLYVKRFYSWKENCFPTTEQQQEELNAALGRLAKRAINQETSRFRLEHQLVREELGDAKQKGSLFWLALKLGWLNKVGLAAESQTQEEVYAFYHPTFEEYFAALTVDDWGYFLTHTLAADGVADAAADGVADETDKLSKLSASSVTKSCAAVASYRIFEPQWKEVILLWLGREYVRKEDKEEFIKALFEFQDGCGEENFYGFRSKLLAAAAIGEFKNCFLADNLVEHLMECFFGSFGSEIEADATIVLVETDRVRAIKGLIELIKSAESESIRRQSAERLGKIGVGNPDAINCLIELIKSAESESIRRQSAERLGKIGVGNPDAINCLIELIKSAESESIWWQVASSLGKIGVGNPDAIKGLIELIKSTESESIRRQSAEILGIIDPGNPDAINCLIELIKSADSEHSRWRVAAILVKIDPDNPDAINCLIELIKSAESESVRSAAEASLRNTCVGNQSAIDFLIELIKSAESEDIRWQAASSLGKIGVGNPNAINCLIELIKSAKSEDIQSQAAAVLGIIDPGNPNAIKVLIELIKSAESEDIRWQAASSLGKIDPGNPNAIKGLIELIKSAESEDIRSAAAASLGKIDPGNRDAINCLIELIKSAESESIRSAAAASLGKIDPGNRDAINCLIELIKSAEFKPIRLQAATTLGNIGVGNPDAIKGLIELINPAESESIRSVGATTLKAILKGDGFRLAVSGLTSVSPHDTCYEYSYNILYHCAKNLPYPAFSQAWHHEEDAGKLGDTFLPQTLQTAITNDTQLKQTIHLICIDTSQFIEPDNPAAEIYLEMVQQGCPDRSQGEPTTMQQLKIYYGKLFRTVRRVVLVFYRGGDTTGGGTTVLCPYNEGFLADLSKLGGAIGVIGEKPTEDIRLQFFSPMQPMEDFLQWLRQV